MSERQCADCGHEPSDHADGLMGAMEGDDHLCHTDDHSCYVARSLARSRARGFDTFCIGRMLPADGRPVTLNGDPRDEHWGGTM